jgi:hypothetical protein
MAEQSAAPMAAGVPVAVVAMPVVAAVAAPDNTTGSLIFR